MKSLSRSRLSKTCQKCPYVDSCQNKRLEALAYYPESMASVTSENINSPMTQPILRETTKINIDGTFVEVYKDDIEKQLYEKLYENLYCGLMNSAT